MKRIRSIALLLLLGACAPSRMMHSSADERTALWDRAHEALASARYAEADSAFERIATEYPDTDEGRESLFYLGALRLDPRNPNWDPDPAETRLRRYLALDTVRSFRIHRAPEARILLEMAHQLNLPAEDRISGLQPEPKVVTVPQRIVRYKDSQEKDALIADLKAQVSDRDTTIKHLQDELERIRRTLTRH
jgi:hypothetical protein